MVYIIVKNLNKLFVAILFTKVIKTLLNLTIYLKEFNYLHL